MSLEQVAGWSSLVAAVATIVGAVFLGLFFQRGGAWGPLNDVASIVLMLATIPVAWAIASIEAEQFATIAWLAAAVGIGGMLLASAAQALLVARLRTYQQLLPWTLGGGAIVGIWYLLVGLLGFRPLGTPLAVLAIASGAGFIGIAYGFTVGNERHPVSVAAGFVLLVASTAFLGLLGWRLVSGDLAVPEWNL